MFSTIEYLDILNDFDTAIQNSHGDEVINSRGRALFNLLMLLNKLCQ